MRANAEVLILEDDAETLDDLRAHFSRKHFHPLGARSAAHAVTALRNNAQSTRPVLAVIDWDLSKAPDQTLTSGDVLSLLSRELPDCLTIVYSANLESDYPHYTSE
jgi:ActR/RegA family two-component response regulator